MSDFRLWCTKTETSVASHTLCLLKADQSKSSQAVEVIAKGLPEYYASPSRIAGLLRQLGKPAAANYVEQKLPTSRSIRSGDLGEILCSAYVTEATSFKQGIKRLRWKDHRNMSMRGEDLLAFSLAPKGGGLNILKAEVKSRASMTSSVIQEARLALSSNGELPSPHAISFVADRLAEQGETLLCDALDKAQLKDGIRATQVTHMLFTFSGSNPLNLLKKNLEDYKGTVAQRYVALQVETHQTFIKAVFDAVET